MLKSKQGHLPITIPTLHCLSLDSKIPQPRPEEGNERFQFTAFLKGLALDVNFASKPTRKSSHIPRDYSSWKNSPLSKNIHSIFVLKATNKDTGDRYRKLISSSEEYNTLEDILPIIMRDPPMPQCCNAIDSINDCVQPTELTNHALSFNKEFFGTLFSNIQLRRKLTQKTTKRWSSSTPIQFRTVGEKLSRFNTSGGSYIPHKIVIDKKGDPFLVARESSSNLNKSYLRCIEEEIQSSRNNENRYKSKRRSLGPHKPIRSSKETKKKTLLQYLEQNFSIVGKSQSTLEYLRGEVTPRLCTIYDNMRSESVGIRGEFMHLLRKSAEVENEISGKPREVKLPFMESDTIYSCDKSQNELDLEKVKRKRGSSLTSKSEHKKRKKKKEKKKKRSKKRKHEKTLDKKNEGVPALHHALTPLVIAETNYKMTSIRQSLDGKTRHQQIFESGMTIKNPSQNVSIATPSIPLDTTPIPMSRSFPSSMGNADREFFQQANKQSAPNTRTIRNERQKTGTNEIDIAAINASQNVVHNVHTSKLIGKQDDLGVQATISRPHYLCESEASNIERHDVESSCHFENHQIQAIAEEPSWHIFNDATQVKKGSESKGNPGYYSIQADHESGEDNKGIDTDRHFLERSGHFKNQQSHTAACTEKPSFNLLCSEKFIETFCQAASELSSGTWVQQLFNQEYDNDTNNSVDAQKTLKIRLYDSILVDDCDVDIELPDYTSMKFVSLSSFGSSNGLNPKVFIKEFIELLSTGRYKMIHLFFILDDTFQLDDHLTEIVNLENAIVKQQGCPCDYLCVRYIKPSILSSSIAMVASKHFDHYSNAFFSDCDKLEKARFLLSIIPSLTAYNSFNLLNEDNTGIFKDILSNACASRKSCIRETSVRQLQVVLRTSLQKTKT